MSEWSKLDGRPLQWPPPEGIPPDDGMLKVEPYVVPSMTAESWRTMSESLFRALVSPGFTVLASPSALDAIKERAAALGINLDE